MPRCYPLPRDGHNKCMDFAALTHSLNGARLPDLLPTSLNAGLSSPYAIGGAVLLGYVLLGNFITSVIRLVFSLVRLAISFPLNLATHTLNRLTFVTRRYGPIASYHLSRPIVVGLLLLGGYVASTKLGAPAAKATAARAAKTDVESALQCSGDIIDLACPRKRSGSDR